MGKDYTTEAKIEAFLGEEVVAGALDNYIAAAELFIDNYTQRNFKAATSGTKLYNGNGRNTIIIDPATTVTKLEVSSDNGLSYVEVPTTEFIKEPFNELPIVKLTALNRIFPYLMRAVKVTGTFGYSATVPADVSYAATVIAAGFYKGKSIEEITSESVGDYSVTYGKDAAVAKLTTIKNILDAYKKLL